MRPNTRASFLSGMGLLALSACSGGATAIPAFRSKQMQIQPCYTSPCPTPTLPGPTPLPNNLSGLTWQQIQALTTSEVYALNDAQIGSISTSPLAAFTAAQCAIFHGSQAQAILNRAAAAQNGAPSPPPSGTNPPPPTYIPEQPQNGWWTWFGGLIGGIMGGAIASTYGGPALPIVGPVGVLIGGAAGSAFAGYVLAPGYDAQYNFWNSDLGQYNSVSISLDPAESSMDSDGFTVTGSYDGSNNTVTITVIPN